MSLIERIQKIRSMLIALSIIWLLLFPLLTYSQTTLWAKPLEQAMLWAEKKPLSRYAQSHFASILIEIDQFEEAEKYYRRMVDNFPQDIGPYVLWLNLACLYRQRVKLPDLSVMIQRFQTAKLDVGAVVGLRFLMEGYAKGECRTDAPTLELMLETLLHNPTPTFYEADLYFIYASFYGIERRYSEAVLKSDQGLMLKYEPHIRMRQIAWLIMDRQLDNALIYVKKARTEFNFFATRLYHQHLDFLEQEIMRLRLDTAK
jgi:tetratricopeptide (TPR) repeat protein